MRPYLVLRLLQPFQPEHPSTKKARRCWRAFDWKADVDLRFCGFFFGAFFDWVLRDDFEGELDDDVCVQLHSRCVLAESFYRCLSDRVM